MYDLIDTERITPADLRLGRAEAKVHRLCRGSGRRGSAYVVVGPSTFRITPSAAWYGLRQWLEDGRTVRAEVRTNGTHFVLAPPDGRAGPASRARDARRVMRGHG